MGADPFPGSAEPFDAEAVADALAEYEPQPGDEDNDRCAELYAFGYDDAQAELAGERWQWALRRKAQPVPHVAARRAPAHRPARARQHRARRTRTAGRRARAAPSGEPGEPALDPPRREAPA
jgi:hypothetical protein